MTPPAAAAAPAVQPGRRVGPRRPLEVAPAPRRVSGPARRPRDGRSAAARSTGQGGLLVGSIEALNRLSEHRVLDRLIRGRIWIGLVAFALIGIVTLQLGLLKLNAGIGHALQRETALQRENAALSIENSELAAGDLVESSAARLGMEMVPVGSLRFLTARPGSDASHVAGALSAPAPSSSTSSGESSSGAAATSSTGSSEGAESSSTQSSEAHSTSSSSSESEAAKASSGESSASSSSAESSGEASQSPAPPSAGSGSTEASAGSGSSEPSGGTQAGTSGK